jgi:hypothetical protein
MYNKKEKPMKYALTSLLILILAIPLGAAVPDVLYGPVTNPVNNHKYYLLSSSDWKTAESKALQLGGHLVTVNDATENSWVFNTFSTYGGVNRKLWIGLNGLIQPGKWVWASGETPAYRNWAPGEPNYSDQEFYVYMYSYGVPRAPQAWNNYYNTANGHTYPGYTVLYRHGVVEVDPANASVVYSTAKMASITSAPTATTSPTTATASPTTEIVYKTVYKTVTLTNVVTVPVYKYITVTNTVTVAKQPVQPAQAKAQAQAKVQAKVQAQAAKAKPAPAPAAPKAKEPKVKTNRSGGGDGTNPGGHGNVNGYDNPNNKKK